MADINSQIESAPIPSIKSLKSRFEQFALDNASVAASAHAKPASALPASTHLISQSHAVLVSESPSTPRSRPRVSLTPDDCIPQSQPPACDVRSKGSNSDLKVAALKRAPPPPPPPRTKKRSPSPIASPLLRPVPVPPAFRSPRASPKHEPLTVGADHKSNGTEESGEEGSLGSVASLRSRFS